MEGQLWLGDGNKSRLQTLIQDKKQQSVAPDEIASQILESSSNQECHDAILTGIAVLTNSTYSTACSSDQEAAKLIKAITSKALSPQIRLAQQADALIGEAGLACLHLLSSKSCHLDESVLLTIVAYTQRDDSWTTSRSEEAATSLLDAQLSGEKREEFITNTVLQGYLKPLFSKASARVTESGRPSRYDISTDRHRQLSDIPAWKQRHPWSVATLCWAVQKSETKLIKNHWPLFTPVMLTLAEDDEPRIKSRGLEILTAFVKKCPEAVLHTTGIGSIFEEVTFPTLLALPSITPEEESVQLLVPAYQVLISLAEAYQDPKDSNRRRILDKTIRHGILTSYHHGSQYAHVVQTLMHYTALIVDCLGIYSIKHLQSLLSMISAVMTDPFATAHPPALLSVARAMNAIIANCWPMLIETEHVEQIIHAISLCWLSLFDNDTASRPSEDDASAISEQLLRSGKMLQAIWKEHNVQPPEKLSEVLKQEPRLKALFLETNM